MSVINTTQMWSHKTAQGNARSNDYTIGWTVLVDSDSDDARTAINQPGIIPTWGQMIGFSASQNQWEYCKNVTAKPIAPRLYEVVATVGVDLAPGSPDRSIAGAGPLGDAPRFDWSTVESSEPTDEDYTGAPIVNAAGEPFEPSPSVAVRDPILTVTRNVPTFNVATMVQYMGGGRWSGATNSDAFLGTLPGQAKLLEWNAGWTFYGAGNRGYWTERLVFGFRKGVRETASGFTGDLSAPGGVLAGGPSRAWYLRIKNEGYRTRVPVSVSANGGSSGGGGGSDAMAAKLVRDKGWTIEQANEYLAKTWTNVPQYQTLTDANGQPLTKPVPLNSAGYPLKTGDAIVWLEFPTAPSLPFSIFNLSLP